MKAKKNREYLALAGIQSIGTMTIYFHDYNWPETMSKLQLLGLFTLLPLAVLLVRIMWIILSSYVINISKYWYFRITKEKIITVCIWPFFWTNAKRSWANFFWIYDDRTCFSMNQYLGDEAGLKKLSAYLLKRNRVLLGIYLLVMLVTECILWKVKWYSIMWMLLFGGIEHILYQMEYKQIGTANAMAFAGVRGIKTRLILHMLVNQSKVERLSLGRDVAEILSAEMYDADGGYFFNYLCLSAMYNEICYGMENELTPYMDEKVENVIHETDAAMKLISGAEKDFKYKYIPPSICLFYANYREFFLYVLMYYKLKGREKDYIRLNNYIQYMLGRVEEECVNNSVLSQYVLSNKFGEYEGLYQNVLDYEFVEETTIFTGYDTLPVWKEARRGFVKKYNQVRECYK